MAEYIERKNLPHEDCWPTEFADGFNYCLKLLRELPAADVRPVVRGEWIFEKGDGKTCVDGWVCSACNYGFHTNVPYFEGFNFCPNCGAWMEES